MLSEIKLGQYFPGNSIIHRLDPRTKILLVILLIITSFSAQNYLCIGLSVFFVVAIMLLSKISLKLYFKSMKVIFFIILFTSVMNLFYGKGYTIFRFGFINVTIGALNNSIFIAARLLCMICIGSALTFTTSPTDLTDALEKLLSPLKIFKLHVNELAMMITIALRFVPTLLIETDKIINAQKSRGADLETGSLISRAKSLIPILVPLFVSSFRRAYDLSIAMDCRCYTGGNNRTRMKVLSFKLTDFIIISLAVITLFTCILTNIFFSAVIM